MIDWLRSHRRQSPPRQDVGEFPSHVPIAHIDRLFLTDVFPADNGHTIEYQRYQGIMCVKADMTIDIVGVCRDSHFREKLSHIGTLSLGCQGVESSLRHQLCYHFRTRRECFGSHARCVCRAVVERLASKASGGSVFEAPTSYLIELSTEKTRLPAPRFSTLGQTHMRPFQCLLFPL